MLPKIHILFGAIFTFLIWAFLKLTFFNLLIIFFSSFLIDVDHYIYYSFKNKDWSLKRAYQCGISENKRGKGKIPKPIFAAFHSIEFFIIFFVVLYLFQFHIILIYTLIGCLFHFFMDILDMYWKDELNLKNISLIWALIKR